MGSSGKVNAGFKIPQFGTANLAGEHAISNGLPSLQKPRMPIGGSEFKQAYENRGKLFGKFTLMLCALTLRGGIGLNQLGGSNDPKIDAEGRGDRRNPHQLVSNLEVRQV